MKKHLFLCCSICFLAGIGVGIILSPEPENVLLSPDFITRLTSQGRAEMKKAVKQTNALLNESVDDILAEKTQMFQAITAKKTDRAAADFYRSGLLEKTGRLQKEISLIFLDSVERMPLMDRRAFMDFYLENRSKIKLDGMILPLTVTAGMNGTEVTP